MDRYEYELEVDSIIIDKGIIGFRGNGIKTISSIPSTEDDGINTVTITTDDGQEFSFTVKNGSKGDKGDKGDKGEKGEGGASKEELGLDKVDNTSDLDKPISNATQEALDTKVNKTGDIMTGDLTSQNIYPNLADTYNLGSDTKMFLNGYIKYLTVQYLKLGGKDCDIVGLHNGLYRGACLYDAVNGTTGVFSSIEDIYTAVHAGNFNDIYIGDYVLIKISSTYKADETVKMVVAGIDYYLNRCFPPVDDHHLVLVPEDTFIKIAKMNNSKTTSGGYAGSTMHTTVLPAYATALSTALGGHLISTGHYISNSVNDSAVNQSGGVRAGASNGYTEVTTNIMLLSEVQVYGSIVWSQAYDIGDANQQLPYFALRPDKIMAPLGYGNPAYGYWWLSGVADLYDYCCIYYKGFAYHLSADTTIGVRPLVLFG